MFWVWQWSIKYILGLLEDNILRKPTIFSLIYNRVKQFEDELKEGRKALEDQDECERINACDVEKVESDLSLFDPPMPP